MSASLTVFVDVKDSLDDLLMTVLSILGQSDPLDPPWQGYGPYR